MKKRGMRLIASAVLFVVALLMPENPWWLAALVFAAAYLTAGYKVLYKAVRNILNGSVFDENFLMSIASIGAFIIGEYPEAVAVMLFYQIGEMFEDAAVGKSRKSISDLMNIRPDYANLVDGDEVRKVEPEEVSIGDIILVRPGEKIPLDGEVVEGHSMIDTAALTGESVPREAEEGTMVMSGCINVNGVLKLRVTKAFGESTVSKILDLVENATMKKAKTENFITRFAAVYTPAVVAAAVLLAVVPPLVIPGAEFTVWLYRALEFLVVSCPCALVISVPLGFFGGIGGASKIGILVKGSNYLEAIAGAKYAVMDKTGTLTKGVFEVQTVSCVDGFSGDKLSGEAEVLRLAALAERHSSHPIGASLKRACEAEGVNIDEPEVTDVEEISGCGVVANVCGKKVAAGNIRLMERLEISYPSEAKEAVGTVVLVAVSGAYAGMIVIADQIKEDAALAVSGLAKKGVETVMLTGDSKAAGEKVAKELGIKHVFTELLPGDKVSKLEEFLAKTGEKEKVIFVGDGINDAPVLARADVGIAMGGLGSDAAIEAADIVIMTDEPSKIAKIMEISKKTMSIVKQNITFALAVKLGVLVLCAMGLVNMWAAVFADVGVSVIAILNSMRAMKI